MPDRDGNQSRRQSRDCRPVAAREEAPPGALADVIAKTPFGKIHHPVTAAIGRRLLLGPRRSAALGFEEGHGENPGWSAAGRRLESPIADPIFKLLFC
jgi:hypothetical protein